MPYVNEFKSGVGAIRAMAGAPMHPALGPHVGALLDCAEALVDVWVTTLPAVSQRVSGATVDMWAYRAYLYINTILRTATQGTCTKHLTAMGYIWMYGQELRKRIDGLELDRAVHQYTTMSAALGGMQVGEALARVGAAPDEAAHLAHAHLAALCASAQDMARLCCSMRKYHNADSARQRAAHAVCVAAAAISQSPAAVDALCTPKTDIAVNQCWLYACVHAVASFVYEHCGAGTPYGAAELGLAHDMLGVHAVGMALTLAAPAARAPRAPPLPWLPEFATPEPEAPAEALPSAAPQADFAPMDLDQFIDELYGTA